MNIGTETKLNSIVLLKEELAGAQDSGGDQALVAGKVSITRMLLEHALRGEKGSDAILVRSGISELDKLLEVLHSEN